MTKISKLFIDGQYQLKTEGCQLTAEGMVDWLADLAVRKNSFQKDKV